MWQVRWTSAQNQRSLNMESARRQKTDIGKPAVKVLRVPVLPMAAALKRKKEPDRKPTRPELREWRVRRQRHSPSESNPTGITGVLKTVLLPEARPFYAIGELVVLVREIEELLAN